jgi:hypothetical protein
VIPARRFAALLLAVLSATLLVACGGGGSSSGGSKPPSDAAGILKDTFGPDKPVKSGKVDLAVAVDATGLSGVSGPLKLSLTGPFQSTGGKTVPEFDFDLALAAGSMNLTAGVTSTGKAGYLKFQGTSYALPDTVFQQFKQGYAKSAGSSDGKKSSGPSLSSLGVDPLRWLKSPKKVGVEDVEGAASNHVSATVDVPSLLGDVDTLLKKAGSLSGVAGAAAGVPTGLTAAQKTQIEQAITATSFDVWAGKDDGILRKLDVSVSFDVPASAQARVGGLKKGTVRLTLTLADLNKDQKVSAPATTKPLNQLTSQISGLLGGLGLGSALGSPNSSSGSGSSPGAGSGGSGSSGSGSSGSGSAAAPSATAATKYAQCLQSAGTDIAKVNACAKLLSK